MPGVKLLDLPQTDLTASNIVLGLMRITELSDEEIRTLVRGAVDAGVIARDEGFDASRINRRLQAARLAAIEAAIATRRG